MFEDVTVDRVPWLDTASKSIFSKLTVTKCFCSEYFSQALECAMD